MSTPQDPFAAPDPNQPPVNPPAPAGQPPAYGQPPVYGQPPAYGQPAYGQPAYGQLAYGQAPPNTGTNTLAIIAFIAAFFCSPAGIIMGFIARSQVKTSGQGGSGLALAAIIIGIASMALGVLFFAAALASSAGSY